VWDRLATTVGILSRALRSMKTCVASNRRSRRALYAPVAMSANSGLLLFLFGRRTRRAKRVDDVAIPIHIRVPVEKRSRFWVIWGPKARLFDSVKRNIFCSQVRDFVLRYDLACRAAAARRSVGMWVRSMSATSPRAQLGRTVEPNISTVRRTRPRGATGMPRLARGLFVLEFPQSMKATSGGPWR
jgi:hypothetical protein